MPKPSSTFAERAAGALTGLAAGRRLALGAAPDGSLALMRILAGALAAGRRDLQALARSWAAEHQARPAGIDPETAAALVHLAQHDAPPSQSAGTGSDPLIRTIPVALAAHDAPRTLASATYHIASLTHPEPLVAWAAVAVNVAVARFLEGKRDFVPEVIEVLRENDAPSSLLEAVRRVPLQGSVRPEVGPAGGAIGDLEAALRVAYYDPRLDRGIARLAAGPDTVGRAGLAGALLGARDGAGALRAAGLEIPSDTELAAVAVRLVRAGTGA